MPGRALQTPLFTANQIRTRIRAMARDIERDYPPQEPLHLVAVLKGAFMFLSDLSRVMTRPVTLDFMAVSSYASGTRSSGEVRVIKDVDTSMPLPHAHVATGATFEQCDTVDDGRCHLLVAQASGAMHITVTKPRYRMVPSASERGYSAADLASGINVNMRALPPPTIISVRRGPTVFPNVSVEPIYPDRVVSNACEDRSSDPTSPECRWAATDSFGQARFYFYPAGAAMPVTPNQLLVRLVVGTDAPKPCLLDSSNTVDWNRCVTPPLSSGRGGDCEIDGDSPPNKWDGHCQSAPQRPSPQTTADYKRRYPSLGGCRDVIVYKCQ